jgi:hypothetical protein
MAVVVSLQDVVAAMDLPNQDWESFLDPETGEIVTVTEDDLSALQDPEPDLLPDWQREVLSSVRRAVESDSFLRLPTSFDIHEWSIMERFCRTVGDSPRHDELVDAIHGTGAFRAFHRSLERLGLRDQWHTYRENHLEHIAREWLESNQIAYK